jgi:hypothetical protein
MLDSSAVLGQQQDLAVDNLKNSLGRLDGSVKSFSHI